MKEKLIKAKHVLKKYSKQLFQYDVLGKDILFATIVVMKLRLSYIFMELCVKGFFILKDYEISLNEFHNAQRNLVILSFVFVIIIWVVKGERLKNIVMGLCNIPLISFVIVFFCIGLLGGIEDNMGQFDDYRFQSMILLFACVIVVECADKSLRERWLLKTNKTALKDMYPQSDEVRAISPVTSEAKENKRKKYKYLGKSLLVNLGKVKLIEIDLDNEIKETIVYVRKANNMYLLDYVIHFVNGSEVFISDFLLERQYKEFEKQIIEYEHEEDKRT